MRRDDIGDETPEGDGLEQRRPEIEEGLDPEAPAGTTPPEPTEEADDADLLEQSLPVTDEDDLGDEDADRAV